MAVNWNQERVGSTLLKKTDADDGIFAITIPVEKIHQGYNALQIEFYMGIVDDFCIDYDNPAVWAVVHNDTSIKFSHEVIAKNLELRNIPAILVDSSLLAENKITLVLPDKPDLAHLNALAVFSTKLGQLTDWRKAAVDVMTISQAITEKPDGNLVVIATNDEINKFNTDLGSGISEIMEQYTTASASQSPINADDGLVTLQTSPFDPNYFALTLSGVSSAAVEKSARGAAFDTLFSQSDGSWVVIRSIPASTIVGDRLSITLEDLGNEDLTAYGTQEQTLQFNLPLSAMWSVDSEAWLDLHFNHSPLLNRNRSTLSILVNSIPISSIALTPENAEDGYEEVLIPLRYLEIGDNDFTLQANMNYANNVTDIENYCTDSSYPRAWLTVQSGSAIRFPDVSLQTPLNLSNFPFGFANPYSFEGFAFALPKNSGISDFTALTDLAFTFGKAMLGNPTDIQLVYAGNDLSDYENFNYVVLIGKVKDLVNQNLNDNLPIAIDTGTGLLQPNDTVMQVDTSTGHTAYLETFEYNQKTIFLTLTAVDSQSLETAGQFLSQSSLMNTLNGNVAVINGADNASAYQTSDSETSAIVNQPAGNTTLTPLVIGSQSIWVLRVALGTLIISTIVLLIALFRKNRHGDEFRGD